MLLSYLLVFSRVCIGFLFFISFISKIQDVSKFEQTITSFGILPKKLSKFLARFILCSELIVVLLLIAGDKLLLELGFALATLLMFIFCIGLISALSRKIYTTCNCFGPTEKLISIYDVWRDISFVTCAFLGWGILTIYGVPKNLNPIEVGSISLVAITFIILMTHLNDIFDLFGVFNN